MWKKVEEIQHKLLTRIKKKSKTGTLATHSDLPLMLLPFRCDNPIYRPGTMGHFCTMYHAAEEEPDDRKTTTYHVEAEEEPEELDIISKFESCQ